jgi:CHASE3 domain sensor protein
LNRSGLINYLHLSSNTLKTAAAFALFELITLGALFGVHQNLQSKFDENNRRLDVTFACDSLSDNLRILGMSVERDLSFYADKRTESSAKCDKAISDLQNSLSADAVERVRFAKLSALVRRYQIAVAEACLEPKVPIAETMKAGFRFKNTHSPIPAIEAELTDELANFKSIFQKKYVVSPLASNCQDALIDFAAVSLLVHIFLAGFLITALHNFYCRDFDEGGAVGGIKTASLGWLRIAGDIPLRQFVLMFVPIALELYALMSLMALQVEARKESAELYSAKRIVKQANLVSKDLYEAGVAMGGYTVCKSKNFEERYKERVDDATIQTEQLRQLVGGNQEKLQSVVRIKQIIKRGIEVLDKAKHAIDDPIYFNQFRARHMYKRIRQLADQLQDELKILTADDRAILDADTATQHKMRTLFCQCFQFDLLLHLGVFAFCLLVLVKRKALPVVSKLLFGKTRI